jgi:hypothetical protein
MTGPANEDLAREILVRFYANPESSPPDVKALAALLRKSNEPVPGGVLAEMLDSRLPRKLARNWELRPFYTGRYDAEMRRVERERLIDAARAAEPTVEKAIAQVDDLGIDGLRGRSIWRLWREMKRRRAWWDKMLEANEPDEDVKASVRRTWRP